jgi:hypothetical protein
MYNEIDRNQAELEAEQAASVYIQNPETKTLREQVAEMNAMNLPDYEKAACLEEINQNAFYGRCVDDPEEIDRLIRDVRKLNKKGLKLQKKIRAAMFRLTWRVKKDSKGKGKAG